MAGWTNTPPTLGSTDVDVWEWGMQFWYAARERWRAVEGKRQLPDVSKIWAEGTVTAAPVDNGDGTSTFTVTTTNPWAAPGGAYPDRWNTGAGSVSSSYPDIFSAACDDDDATKAISGAVITNTSTTITFAVRVLDYVTGKCWANLAEAIGRSVYVTRNGEPWWNDDTRIPPWPNAASYFDGTVLSATSTTLRVDNTTFATGYWNAYEIMVRDTTGKLHRLTVTATTTDTSGANPVGVLTFTADSSGTPTGTFTIIKAGGRFLPGRPYCFPCQYYSGRFLGGVPSHDPFDVLRATPIGAPVPSEKYNPTENPGDDCGDTSDQILLDNDLKTLDQAVCVAPSSFRNPHVTRTLRWLQAFLESLSRFFLPSASAQGSSRTAAWNGFGVATWLAAAGADSWSGTVSGGTISPSGFEYSEGCPVIWDIKDPNGGVIKEGVGTITSGSPITVDTMYNGFPVVVVAGWTRIFEKAVDCLFDRAYFRYDTADDGSAVIPPTSAKPGTWTPIAKPTHYQETNYLGTRGESAKPHYQFSDGDIARLIGRTWSDPSNPFGLADDGFTPTLLATYYDRAINCRRRPAIQGRVVASMTGKVTQFSARQLVDPLRNWWSVDFYGDNGIGDGHGVLVTHSGTDSISSTSATLSSASGSGFFTQTPPRFLVNGGATIRFRTGFDADSNPIWAYRQLATQSGISITWGEAMTVTGSLYWELIEPDSYPNRWKGRQVKLVVNLDDGTSMAIQTVKLDGNADRVLFLPSTGVTVPGNAVSIDYSIFDLEMETGAAIQYTASSGEWALKTSGTDAVRRGVVMPANFRSSAYQNLPHLMKDYGRMVPGDMLLPHTDMIQAGINAMTDTWDTGGWISKGENNQYTSSGDNGFTGTGTPGVLTLAVAEGAVSSHWGTTGSYGVLQFDGHASVSSVDAAPTASIRAAYFLSADGTNVSTVIAGGGINYAYYQTVEPPIASWMPTHTSTGWGWAAMDSFDTDPYDLINCNQNVKFAFLPVDGFALRTWKSIGNLSSDGAGHEISAQVWNTTEPPFPSPTSATLYDLLSSDPVVTCTSVVHNTDAGDAFGKAIILADRVVRHWTFVYHG